MHHVRAVLAILTICIAPAFAQESTDAWPSRPITLVVPFAAGGGNDVLARIIAQPLSEILKQPVVIENVAGAGGMTGGNRVAKAAPDGYTAGLGTVGSHAFNQTLYKKPLYHAANDFAPVAHDRRPAAAPRGAQGLAGQQSQGVRRLRQGEPEQDAARLGRRRLGDASRLPRSSTPRSASTSRTFPTRAARRR